MKVPFLDLKKQYSSLKSELDKAWANVVGESAFIRSHYVNEFESAFAQQLSVKHCIGVANGTDAIYIILKMLGIGAGDEVITVANTWISTSETITQAGAKPVFVDCEPSLFCIDPALIEQRITTNTKAVIAVHLYGQAADLTTLKDICDKHNLLLIEDCAQSHFTTYKEKFVGTYGIAASFSFYPGKNLGAYGDAGAIATNDDNLARLMRRYANHGSLVKHKHEVEGINSRLDGLQAAILSAKLPHLLQWNESRRQHAAYYYELLKDIKEIISPRERKDTRHTYHLFVIRAQKRNELQAFLKDKGVETQIHYPAPLPFLPAYNYLGHQTKDFPMAAAYQGEILSLPMFPELERKEIEYVVSQIKAFYQQA